MWIKNVLIALLALILIAVTAIFIFIGIANYGVGARELTEKDLSPNWMVRINDEAKLNELYIPGTHDSGALHSFLGVSGKCQSYSIKDQLNMGIRFFDIRLQLRNDELAVVHSFVDQKLSFEEVLRSFREFLESNPSELLIVSIKEDADPESSTVPFASAVEKALADGLFSHLNSSNSLPSSVGEARGKAHIIARYSNATLGVPAHSGWYDSTSFEIEDMYVQDYYAIDTVESKIADISKAFDIANKKDHSLVLNFTSCYLKDAMPPAHAPTTAKKINPQLFEMISSGKVAPCVFVSDFVTPELIQSIINKNFE